MDMPTSCLINAYLKLHLSPTSGQVTCFDKLKAVASEWQADDSDYMVAFPWLKKQKVGFGIFSVETDLIPIDAFWQSNDKKKSAEKWLS